jgi:hypothetical protein
MAKKKYVLRLDEDLYQAVEKWAADEFRSVNGQLEWIIYKMLKDARRLKPEQEELPPPAPETGG